MVQFCSLPLDTSVSLPPAGAYLSLGAEGAVVELYTAISLLTVFLPVWSACALNLYKPSKNALDSVFFVPPASVRATHSVQSLSAEDL